jgi:DNA-binding Lrp family transcriptional regulator
MLTNDSRISYSYIASALALSVNTVKNRIKRILTNNVIESFVTHPNFALFGFDISFHLLIRYRENPDSITNLMAGLGYIYMKVNFFDNILFFRILLKKGQQVASAEDIEESLKPNEVIVTFQEELYCNFAPLQTDWKMIYWLILKPRIGVRDLARRASVTERTIIRRLRIMRLKHALNFSIRYNPAFMNNYLYFRMIVITDQLLAHNVIDELHQLYKDHFILITSLISKSIILLVLFSRNIPELESVKKEIGSIKGVLNIIPVIPLTLELYQNYFLERIREILRRNI